MTSEQRALCLTLLQQHLQDNLGQRLTMALCNGLLTTIDGQLPKAEPAAAPQSPPAT